MAEVSRLKVLEHAREIAERVGAVKDGNQFFEDGANRPISPGQIRTGRARPEDVCGVCIAGALALAEILDGGGRDSAWLEITAEQDRFISDAARVVLGDEADLYEDEEITQAITDKGTPYVLAVLDRMIEREREAVAA